MSCSPEDSFMHVTITIEDDKEDKEGSLEEIQIARPVNMKMCSLSLV